MDKLILFFTLIGVSLLFYLGLADTSNPLMWLASDSINYTILRLGMILMLTLLILTQPPRNAFVRLLVGVFAISLAGWTTYATYNNSMYILDGIICLGFSVSTGIMALESKLLSFETLDERIASAHRSHKMSLISVKYHAKERG